jgi:hypothetical protein
MKGTASVAPGAESRSTRASKVVAVHDQSRTFDPPSIQSLLPRGGAALLCLSDGRRRASDEQGSGEYGHRRSSDSRGNREG